MARESTVFVCQQCGASAPKWAGQCPSCGEWNSLVEQVVSTRKKGRGRRVSGSLKPIKLSEVEGISEKLIPTGIGEFDRVLGGSVTDSAGSLQAGSGLGGVVPGSVVLLAGEPGIGKSTLLTQLALRVGQTSTKHEARNPKQKQHIKYQNPKKYISKFDIRNSNLTPTVLYVCGEESPAQIKMRIDRLASSVKGLASRVNLLFLPEVDVDAVVATIEKEKPTLVIIDSIQTMVTQDLTSSAGSVSQVSETASRLTEVAKKLGTAMFLVGHVTKEGAIAGPKVLEHMVDCVLELSGDRLHEFRLLRATKNRFGATDEVGIFAMEETGMQEVANPSDRFLTERQEKVPGSSLVCVMEGTRPMLVEIQALVVPSSLAVPRRVASGVDSRRVQLLTAVLTKRCGLRLGNMDIYVNVAGGLIIREPASDFGIALAIASSSKNKPLPTKSVVIGEVGLLGEVRKVGRLNKRLAEAKAQGLGRLITANEYSSLNKAIRGLLR